MVDPDLHERLFFLVNVATCTSPMDAMGMGATEPTARTLNHEFPMSHPRQCDAPQEKTGGTAAMGL